MTSTFEVGKVYQARSIGDYNCKITVTILARTKCFVTAQETSGGKSFKEPKRYKIETWDSSENIWPWGKYSMCTPLGAYQELESGDDLPEYAN